MINTLSPSPPVDTFFSGSFCFYLNNKLVFLSLKDEIVLFTGAFLPLFKFLQTGTSIADADIQSAKRRFLCV
jgi:hypothetical protein